MEENSCSEISVNDVNVYLLVWKGMYHLVSNVQSRLQNCVRSFFFKTHRKRAIRKIYRKERGKKEQEIKDRKSR